MLPWRRLRIAMLWIGVPTGVGVLLDLGKLTYSDTWAAVLIFAIVVACAIGAYLEARDFLWSRRSAITGCAVCSLCLGAALAWGFYGHLKADATGIAMPTVKVLTLNAPALGDNGGTVRPGDLQFREHWMEILNRSSKTLMGVRLYVQFPEGIVPPIEVADSGKTSVETEVVRATAVSHSYGEAVLNGPRPPRYPTEAFTVTIDRLSPGVPVRLRVISEVYPEYADQVAKELKESPDVIPFFVEGGFSYDGQGARPRPQFVVPLAYDVVNVDTWRHVSAGAPEDRKRVQVKRLNSTGKRRVTSQSDPQDGGPSRVLGGPLTLWEPTPDEDL